MYGLVGTFVNTATVLLGGIIGLVFKKGIPERVGDSVFKVLGLITALSNFRVLCAVAPADCGNCNDYRNNYRRACRFGQACK